MTRISSFERIEAKIEEKRRIDRILNATNAVSINSTGRNRSEKNIDRGEERRGRGRGDRAI